MRDLYKYVLVGIVCLLIGAAGTALAMHTGGGEVRLVAQRHGDGRVEIGLQEREAGGGWSERQLPNARFLSAEAEAGRWLVSSPLDVGAGRYQDGALFCIVGHGQADDIFWSGVDTGSEQAAEDMKMNLRFVTGSTPDKQAGLVRECVEDGAVAIASTLAAPETLAPALAEARAAGVQIVTFNSGAEYAAASSSAMHIGLDDRLGGERSGETFNANGIEGRILCIIHEAENVGLEERCDGLEATFEGTVERLRIDSTGVSDLAGSQAQIAERLEAGGVSGILLLNGGLRGIARNAIGERQIVLATFGLDLAAIFEVLERQLLFVVYDHPHVQAYTTAGALAQAGFHGRFGDASLVLGGTKVLLEPVVFDLARAQATAQALAGMVERFRGGQRSGGEGEGAP